MDHTSKATEPAEDTQKPVKPSSWPHSPAFNGAETRDLSPEEHHRSMMANIERWKNNKKSDLSR